MMLHTIVQGYMATQPRRLQSIFKVCFYFVKSGHEKLTLVSILWN